MARHRSVSVDATRVVLTLATVCLHVGQMEAAVGHREAFGARTADRLVATLGIGGVTTFFALSGYFTVSGACGGTTLAERVGRIARRTARMYPLVLAATALALVSGSFGVPDGVRDWGGVAAWLTLTATLRPDGNRVLASTWSGPLWSTLVDVHASALLHLAPRRTPWALVAVLCALAKAALLLWDPCTLRLPFDPLLATGTDVAPYAFGPGYAVLHGRPAVERGSEVAGCEALTWAEQQERFVFLSYSFTLSRLTPFAIGAWFASAHAVRPSSARRRVAASAVLAGAVASAVVVPPSGAPLNAGALLVQTLAVDTVLPLASMTLLTAAPCARGGEESGLLRVLVPRLPWVYALHMPVVPLVRPLLLPSLASTLALTAPLAEACFRVHRRCGV